MSTRLGTCLNMQILDMLHAFIKQIISVTYEQRSFKTVKCPTPLSCISSSYHGSLWCSQTDFGEGSDQTSVKSQSYTVVDRQMVAKDLKMCFCNVFFCLYV